MNKTDIKKTSLGFTLIEVLISVAIIGILASIALPSYKNYIRKAQMTEGVVLMSEANKIILENIAFEGKPPSIVSGAGGNDRLKSLPSHENVELIRYDARNFDNGKIWFVVRYNRSIFPSDYGDNWREREIHLVIVRNSAGEWVTKCGQYSGGFMSSKYLPKGCDETRVGFWSGDD